MEQIHLRQRLMKRRLLVPWISKAFWSGIKVQSKLNHMDHSFLLLPRRYICVSTTRLDATTTLRYPTSVSCNDGDVKEGTLPFSPLPSETHTSDVDEPAVGLMEQQRVALRDAFDALLENRQALYRDAVVVDSLQHYRTEIKHLFLQMAKSTRSENSKEFLSRGSSADGEPCALDARVIPMLKDAWLQARGDSSVNDPRKDIHRFYSLLLSSALVASNADVKVVLNEMLTNDGLSPNHEIYESIIESLLLLNSSAAASVGAETADNSKQGDKPKYFVLGQPCTLDRAVTGDLAGYYMGHALAHFFESNSRCSPGELFEKDGDQYLPLWGCFMEICALTDVTSTLMDLWWKKLCDFCDRVIYPNEEFTGERPAMSPEAPQTGTLKAPLPFRSVYAMLAWCVRTHDLERCLRYFHEANARGLICDYPRSGHLGDGLASPPPLSLRHPGSLTKRSCDPAVQQLQLRLLVKLMSTAKSVRMDGGLKAIIVDDVKRLIDPSVLFQAPWGVINDLVSGLSVPSAMQLVKVCSSQHEQGDWAVPFSIWASLLRRCAREHHLDEAVSLFLFIRKRFSLSSVEKRELVEIIMRMYATLPTPDFSSAMSIFLEHVLRTPKGEPEVVADHVLYNLLIKAADSRNASMMIFLEGCAAGAGMDFETFENLLSSHPFSAVASLSRKLPHDYLSTKLDTHLRIPANVDAHLRREEAQQARGKAAYDSTGDSS